MKYNPQLFALCLCIAALSLPATAQELVVHEWGVQVLGRTAEEPILTAPSEPIAGLPRFVGINETVAPTCFHAMGWDWDKPVLHLYGNDGLEVSVKVSTPLGMPLAYYPPPQIEKSKIFAQSRRKMIAGELEFASSLHWRGKLRTAAVGDLPAVPDEHWWQSARAIPSSYFVSDSGSERFLFYEATALLEPAISSTIDDSAITLTNRHDAAVGPVVVLVNDGAGIRGGEIPTVGAEGDATLAQTALQKWGSERALDACRRQWLELGMTKAEADAIIEVWKSDLLGRPGVLVITPMPRSLYDQMFPIEIKPEPTELVRAGLVFDFLPGQAARADWLPELRQALLRNGNDLAADTFEKRQAAHREFLAAGDLALGVLEELMNSNELESRAAAKKLTAQIRAAADLGLSVRRPDKQNAETFVENLYPGEVLMSK